MTKNNDISSNKKIPIYDVNFPKGSYLRVKDGETTRLVNFHSSVAIIKGDDLIIIPLKKNTTPEAIIEAYKNGSVKDAIIIKNWDKNFIPTNY